jgi:alcohol dehydrogenase
MPGPHELLIRVHAAGLNPTDSNTRRGKLLLLFYYPLPVVMGKEFAGTVVARGPEATHFMEGERVFGRVAQNKMGAFAEYVAVHEDFVAKMPTSLDFETAAGMPLAGLTALQCLRDELVVKPGQRIFISGGAGGVGTFAIQIAKWLGAEVATTVSPRGEALAHSLGADLVIDYTRERFEDVLHNFEGALDLIGGST